MLFTTIWWRVGSHESARSFLVAGKRIISYSTPLPSSVLVELWYSHQFSVAAARASSQPNLLSSSCPPVHPSVPPVPKPHAPVPEAVARGSSQPDLPSSSCSPMHPPVAPFPKPHAPVPEATTRASSQPDLPSYSCPHVHPPVPHVAL